MEALPSAAEPVSGARAVRPRVSVVVTARNAAHQLPLLLDALDRQTLPASVYELIVVDDGSTDGTAQVAEARPRTRVIRSSEPVGLPRGRNLGIRAARGTYVALTDADTVPDPTWLELGVKHLDASGADLLGGGVSIDIGDKPSVAAMVDAINWLDQEMCVSKGFAVGANLWVRRETFDRVGMFDEDIASYGHDDVEFGQRAKDRGAKLVYRQDVHLVHPPRSRLAEVRNKSYRLGFGLAPHRRLDTSHVRGEPPLFLRPSPFMPPRRLRLARLRDLGYEPTLRDRVVIYLAQYFCVRLPKIWGDLRGELAYVRSARGPGA